MSHSRGKAIAFVAVLGAYYVFYYILFAGKVAEYLRDVLRHFEFARRFF